MNTLCMVAADGHVAAMANGPFEHILEDCFNLALAFGLGAYHYPGEPRPPLFRLERLRGPVAAPLRLAAEDCPACNAAMRLPCGCYILAAQQGRCPHNGTARLAFMRDAIVRRN